jgi:hypothetical protein
MDTRFPTTPFLAPVPAATDDDVAARRIGRTDSIFNETMNRFASALFAGNDDYKGNALLEFQSCSDRRWMLTSPSPLSCQRPLVFACDVLQLLLQL